MHSAARRSGPAAAGPDLEGSLAAVVAESSALLRRLGPGAPERLILELIDLNDRLAALRIAHEDHAAEIFCRDEMTGSGRTPGRAAQPSLPAPRPRRPGQLPLTLVAKNA